MEFNLNLSASMSGQKAVPLNEGRTYDVLIVGGGPAAMTAAVYSMRKGMVSGLLTADFGGQVAETAAVENYLGFRYIDGVGLAGKFREQVEQFKIGLREGVRAETVEDGPVKTVVLGNGERFRARSLIITTGKSWRRLGVPGEKELTGRGVAYCSICDAPLFAGKTVAVVGGGNSGVESAIDLAKIASRVVLVQFLETLTADRILIDTLKTFGNVEILYEHEVTAIKGTDRVTAALVRDRKSGAERDLTLDGVFVEIGLVPNSGLVKGVVELNEFGEITVDCACRTNCPGILAAGDVTSVPYKQIIIAAGEGAKAALSAYDYLLKEKV